MNSSVPDLIIDEVLKKSKLYEILTMTDGDPGEPKVLKYIELSAPNKLVQIWILADLISVRPAGGMRIYIPTADPDCLAKIIQVIESHTIT